MITASAPTPKADPFVRLEAVAGSIAQVRSAITSPATLAARAEDLTSLTGTAADAWSGLATARATASDPWTHRNLGFAMDGASRGVTLLSDASYITRTSLDASGQPIPDDGGPMVHRTAQQAQDDVVALLTKAEQEFIGAAGSAGLE